MSDKKFDRLVAEIRNAHVDEQMVSQASERVWSSISASPTAALSMHKLRSCEDFQALIPEYLDETLPEARRLLFQDHVHQCVACRHAVEQVRNGELQPIGNLTYSRRHCLEVSRCGSGPWAQLRRSS